MVPLLQEQTLFQHQLCLCGKRQPCAVVSVRTTELKTHHAERGAAQERTHENA